MAKDNKKAPRSSRGTEASESEAIREGFNWQLARAYVPYQKYTTKWNPEEALAKGTVFPELYRPYQKKDR